MKTMHETEASTVTFGDLVEAFYDAAMEVCNDEEEAKTAALVALQHFLTGHRNAHIASRTDRGKRVAVLALTG
jgi:hypothetical protein